MWEDAGSKQRLGMFGHIKSSESDAGEAVQGLWKIHQWLLRLNIYTKTQAHYNDSEQCFQSSMDFEADLKLGFAQSFTILRENPGGFSFSFLIQCSYRNQVY